MLESATPVTGDIPVGTTKSVLPTAPDKVAEVVLREWRSWVAAGLIEGLVYAVCRKTSYIPGGNETELTLIAVPVDKALAEPCNRIDSMTSPM